MFILKYLETSFRKYIIWKGRASRAEFWWFFLFIIIGNILTILVDSLYNTPILTPIFYLATLLPTLSVTIRRFHDTEHSGWWYWIFFLPIVIYTYEAKKHKLLLPIFGFMYVIKLCITKSDEGENEYGPAPSG
jgi:uncharacterized membrane protein YhaH (DUF805 family)